MEKEAIQLMEKEWGDSVAGRICYSEEDGKFYKNFLGPKSKRVRGTPIDLVIRFRNSDDKAFLTEFGSGVDKYIPSVVTKEELKKKNVEVTRDEAFSKMVQSKMKHIYFPVFTEDNTFVEDRSDELRFITSYRVTVDVDPSTNEYLRLRNFLRPLTLLVLEDFYLILDEYTGELPEEVRKIKVQIQIEQTVKEDEISLRSLMLDTQNFLRRLTPDKPLTQKDVFDELMDYMEEQSRVLVNSQCTNYESKINTLTLPDGSLLLTAKRKEVITFDN